MRPSTSSAVGCGSPGGGMSRPRSFTIAASNCSACWGTSSSVRPSNESSPASSAGLWHSVQYRSSTAKRSLVAPLLEPRHEHDGRGGGGQRGGG